MYHSKSLLLAQAGRGVVFLVSNVYYNSCWSLLTGAFGSFDLWGEMTPGITLAGGKRVI